MPTNEEEIFEFTRAINNFVRQKDYESSLILLDDLKNYITTLKKEDNKSCQTP